MRARSWHAPRDEPDLPLSPRARAGSVYMFYMHMHNNNMYMSMHMCMFMHMYLKMIGSPQIQPRKP